MGKSPASSDLGDAAWVAVRQRLTQIERRLEHLEESLGSHHGYPFDDEAEEEYSSESRLAADSMSARKRKRVVDSGGDDDSVTGAESSTQVAKVRKVNEGSPSTADSWSDAKSVGKPVSWCRVK